ncbi:lipase, partial [Haematococcus lacustris]
MVDHVGKQLETAFSNMLTLLFAGRLKKSVSLAGAKVLVGTEEHRRRFGFWGLGGGHLPSWSKRECTYVRRMVCGLEVTWLVGEVLLPAGSGYELTEHFATTLDGYILRIFRLQHPSSQAAALAPGNSSTPARLMPRPVALLQHALLDSSAGWLLQGPGNSLACSLALEGWDVWLGNVRGNRFSRNHTHLSAADQEFWAYSWDHHAAL